MKKTIIALMALAGVAIGTESITLNDAAGAIYGVSSTNDTLSLSDYPSDITAYTLTANLKVKDFLSTLYTSASTETNTPVVSVQLNGGAHIGTAIRFWSSSNETDASLFSVHTKNNTVGSSAADGFSNMSTGYTVTWAKTVDGVAAADVSRFTSELTAWGYNSTDGSSNVDKMVFTMTYPSAGVATSYLSVYLNDGTVFEYSGASAAGFKFTYSDISSFAVNSALVSDAVLFTGVKTADQIKTVHFLIPEPTTATLSLLALAGLAARRRRK